MPRGRESEPKAVPCFALTVPGLESIAADEIETDLGGQVKRVSSGLIVFRLPEVDRRVLRLRTVEDVFLLAWGTDDLSFRAEDLERFRGWTAKEANWAKLFQLHQGVRPKRQGKPSYHLVTQMRGEHGYRRVDAAMALAQGLAGKIPQGWRAVIEHAALEIWMIIHGPQAVCGVRLSDRTMRHRTYKQEHMPASLRPVVAAAMVRLAKLNPQQLLVDPMCGAGTIIAERLAVNRNTPVLGGDVDRSSVIYAHGNLLHWQEQPNLVRWDAREMPLKAGSVPGLACNPPFGKQLGNPEEIGRLYAELVHEWNRVLTPDGVAVVLVADLDAFQRAAWAAGWQQEQRHRVRLLGQPATILAWRKPAAV